MYPPNPAPSSSGLPSPGQHYLPPLPYFANMNSTFMANPHPPSVAGQPLHSNLLPLPPPGYGSPIPVSGFNPACFPPLVSSSPSPVKQLNRPISCPHASFPRTPVVTSTLAESASPTIACSTMATSVYLIVPFPRAPSGSGRALSAANVTPTPTPVAAHNSDALSFTDDYRSVCEEAENIVPGASVTLLVPGSSTSPSVPQIQSQQPQHQPGPISPPSSEHSSPHRSIYSQVTSSHSSPSNGVHVPSDIFTASIRADSLDAALRVRAELLARNPARTSAIVRVNRHLLLNANDELRPVIKANVSSIQTSTNTQITVLGEVPSVLGTPPGIPPENTAVEISGAREQVYTARIQLLVALDACAGLFVDGSLDLDPKCHYVIAGRKASDLHHIMRATNTNIYLPSPFAVHVPLSFNAPIGWENHLRPGQGRIYITGDRARVNQAREMILRAVATKKFMSRSLNTPPRKLDWMLTHRKDHVLRFMYDNGTFIAFPPLGSGQSHITVYGDNFVSINRTIESVARLACEFFIAEIRLLPAPSMMHQSGCRNPIVAPGAFAPSYTMSWSSSPSAYPSPYGTGPGAPLSGTASMAMAPPLTSSSASAFAAVLGRVSQAFNTEIVLTSDGVIEIYGSDYGVSEAFKAATRTEWVARAPRSLKFRVELDIRHKEFISGKKNGKINKIIKASDASVVFDDWNEINMVIDVGSPYPDRALEGFALLKDELPAEVSFHVPEVHHKRIIGVGGKNIQRIMKKFGVFVKFANADEHAGQGGYIDNDDNVIARTPSKNANNLIPLKGAILECAIVPPMSGPMYGSGSPRPLLGQGTGPQALIEPINHLTSVPIRHHRWLASTLSGIEAAAVVKIRMPNSEAGNDEVLITGHEPNVELALNLVGECTPEVYMVHVVRRTPHFLSAIRSPAFREQVLDPAKSQFDVDIVYIDPLPEPSDDQSESDFKKPSTDPEPDSDASKESESSSVVHSSPTPSQSKDEGNSSGAFLSIQCPRRSVKHLAAVHELALNYMRENNIEDALQFPSPPPAMADVAHASSNFDTPIDSYAIRSQPFGSGFGLSVRQPLQPHSPYPGYVSGSSNNPGYPQMNQEHNGVESAFRHFNSRLFSSASLADTLAPGGMTNGSIPNNSSGNVGAMGAMTSRTLGYSSNQNSMCVASPTGSPPSLREIFDNPGPNGNCGGANLVTSSKYPGFNPSPRGFSQRHELRRSASEYTANEAYAQMISPTTAAELPFLATDPWQSSPFPYRHSKHQLQQSVLPQFPDTTSQPHQESTGTIHANPENGIFTPRGIFEFGSLMDSLPATAGRSPHVAPARPSAKNISPLQVVVDQNIPNGISPPTPLSLSACTTQSVFGPTSPGVTATDLSAGQIQDILSSSNPISCLCKALRLDDKYELMFREQEVDLDVLMSMTDAELRELGVVAFGPRKKLLAVIQELVRATQRM